MSMASRLRLIPQDLLLPIRSPLIWGTGALPQCTGWRKRNKILMYEHLDNMQALMSYRTRAISAPLDTGSQEVQLSSNTVQAILFDMDGVLCNSEEMTQR